MEKTLLVDRRRSQLRFKLFCGFLPLLLIGPLAFGIVVLFDDMLSIVLGSSAWYMLLAITALLLLIFYASGFFAGSLRLDGNVLSVLSRMDPVEQKALSSVLTELERISKEKP